MHRSLRHPFSLHSSRIGHCFRCFGGSNWSRHVPSISKSHFWPGQSSQGRILLWITMGYYEMPSWIHTNY
ncbi:hypothetical protein OG21DRAFT_1509171, partial [Imleria badia]